MINMGGGTGGGGSAPCRDYTERTKSGECDDPCNDGTCPYSLTRHDYDTPIFFKKMDEISRINI